MLVRRVQTCSAVETWIYNNAARRLCDNESNLQEHLFGNKNTLEITLAFLIKQRQPLLQFDNAKRKVKWNKAASQHSVLSCLNKHKPGHKQMSKKVKGKTSKHQRYICSCFVVCLGLPALYFFFLYITEYRAKGQGHLALSNVMTPFCFKEQDLRA